MRRVGPCASAKVEEREREVRQPARSALPSGSPITRIDSLVSLFSPRSSFLFQPETFVPWRTGSRERTRPIFPPGSRRGSSNGPSRGFSIEVASSAHCLPNSSCFWFILLSYSRGEVFDPRLLLAEILLSGKRTGSGQAAGSDLRAPYRLHTQLVEGAKLEEAGG